MRVPTSNISNMPLMILQNATFAQAQHLICNQTHSHDTDGSKQIHKELIYDQRISQHTLLYYNIVAPSSSIYFALCLCHSLPVCHFTPFHFFSICLNILSYIHIHIPNEYIG